MPPRSLRTLFYTYSLPQATSRQDMNSFLLNLLDADQNNRTATVDGIQLRISRITQDQNGFKIAIARARTGNWPYWMRNDEQELNEVPINDGTLGEVSFFWIMPLRNLMMEVYNRQGPSQATLRDFLINKSISRGLSLNDFSFRAIFEEDQYERFLRATRTQRIQFKVNIANAPRQIIDQQVGSREVERSLRLLGEASGGMDIEVGITVGRGKTLSVDGIRRMVDSLRNSEDTRTLKVKATEDPDGKLEEINLLDGRLEHRANISFQGNYLPSDEYVRHLQAAFLAHQSYLELFSE